MQSQRCKQRPCHVAWGALLLNMDPLISCTPLLLHRLLAGPGPHFAIYSADLVDGQPWCPDCVRTLPAVKEGIAKGGSNSHQQALID